ncbi:MAG: 3-deoxy-8-phosphooctulonate synthase [Deltaproteobacteria bacterium]|nr:3-deoxy-8-phosphooctulonate synthase [Deltaproteobacteria bacterium]
MPVVDVGGIRIGANEPLALIAGPCVLEDEHEMLSLAISLAETCAHSGIPMVFKASFDKANRTSLTSYRGPGLEEGLRILAAIRRAANIPLTTDVHLPDQAARVAEIVDLLQVPAFLCRQTDLLVACGATGRPVNLKKGQFVAPSDMRHAIDKVAAHGDGGVLVTERGTTFGYHDLVADMRSIGTLRALGVPVVFDATHAVQRPGGAGDRSGGQREHVPALARAAVAAGADAVFLEVHPEPARALSDAATQLPLAEFPALVRQLTAIGAVVRG